ncbi:MAG: MBL fold metallo-hydrolase, partial [Planctomycetota bacterium]|nr:MBL fold metallo-hydrolase [Planctomycetota bacterium]
APTVAIELSYGGRKAVICTDCGHPRNDVAPPLRGAHVLVLEFNYDPELLAAGPYPPKLQKRIRSDHGHLSNGQAQELLRDLVTPDLHTLVLAHLSKKTNSPELALAAARATLEDLGRSDVEVLVAAQHEIGPNLKV